MMEAVRPEPEPELSMKATGALVYDGMVIGSFAVLNEARITLDLGWMEMAGIGLTVRGAPDDTRRVVLQRPKPEADVET